MTYPTWPTELEKILLEGYSAEFGNSRQISRPRDAFIRSKRKVSRVPQPIQFAIFATPDQKQRFERFWFEEIEEGNSFFYIPDPELYGKVLADESLASITTRDGAPIEISNTWLCMFDEQPPRREWIAGTNYRLSMNILVMP
ncbi:MAG: hypothetical protein AAF468_20205 [Pseudomonadota bacterium]